MMQNNSMILKLREGLDYPTFPINPLAFRVQEEWLAATPACSLLHGTHRIHQDTFLKVYLLQENHLQHSSEVRRIWHRLLADQRQLIQAKLRTEKNLRTVPYRHLDLPGCFRLAGILCIMQTELFLKIECWKFRGIRSRSCISINSLHLQHSSAGRRASRPRYVPVQVTIPFGRNTLDQRSGDGRFGGRSYDAALNSKLSIPEL